jgi:transmembrane sensor
MSKKDAKALLSKYNADTASAEERAIVENWMLHGAESDLDLSDEELVQELSEIRQRLGIDQPQKKVARLWPRIAAAASVIICLSIGSYFLLHKKALQQIAQNQIHDIAPGGNKAILTLADGKKIVLTDAKKGKLAEQGGTVINKTQDGEVVYTAVSTSKVQPIIYNSIETPGGGQYHLTLADGTNVWLNAASSIKYPSAFTGNTRDVELTGEAYFEVVHNTSRPFRVKTSNELVEDIGTHFNINAYDDEPIMKTTLQEGSIRIEGAGTSVVLKPGQETRLTGNKIEVMEVDADKAIAWQKGYFYFDHADIKSVMRQMARWYNVKVVYQGQLPKKLFKGKIYRNVSITQALKILGFFNVHFKIEGNLVTVIG